MLLSLIIGLLVLYSGLCLLLYFFQEKYIFFPTPLATSQRELLQNLYPNSEIQIKTPDGVTLQGWLLKVADPKHHPLLIYYGGNAEDLSDNLGEAQKIPEVSQLYFNYRGYGGSGGQPSERALLQDALQVFDTMVQREGFSPDQIFLMGRSLGSGVAVHVARHRKVKGVILVSPFDSLRAIGQKAYPFFPVSLFLKHPFDSIRLAPEIEAPLLMIIAQQDQIIPKENSLNLLNHWKGKTNLLTIPNADHNDLHWDIQYWQSIQQFISNREKGSSTFE